MKFSIVTCTLNSEAWLAASIASVQAQRHRDVEQIFVDGGSTDGTLDLIAQVPGNVRLVREPVSGISAAMNAGVAAATGDIVAHLHSDDVYLGEHVFERVAGAFERNPRADWVVGRCKSIIDGELHDNHFETKRFSRLELLRGNIVPHPSTFVRREAFLASGGFSTRLRYAMDYDLWLRLAQVSDPVQLPDYLAAFRFHAASTSTANPWPCLSEDFRVRVRHAGFDPLGYLEHAARLAVRSWRLRRSLRAGFRPAGA
ncbi:MAG: glycosyltransferase [Lautropia sp.]